MPVALAIAANERSISAQRITKVSPTAMMPVIEMLVRMLPRLSTVTKDGLATAKNTTSAIRVTNGAMLRICDLRNDLALLEELPAVAVWAFIVKAFLPQYPWSSSGPRRSGGFEQPVLADGLVGEFLDDPPLLHHHDTIGQRQHGLR